MALTILIAALAVCGVFLIAWAVADALLFRAPADSCHIFYLRGEDAQVEQQVRSCLWLRRRCALRGSVVLVDCGISPEAQITAHLMLKDENCVHVCSFEQINDYIGLENKSIGTGAD